MWARSTVGVGWVGPTLPIVVSASSGSGLLEIETVAILRLFNLAHNMLWTSGAHYDLSRGFDQLFLR